VPKGTLLDLNAPAELVVNDCRRLAAQLLYFVLFIHPRQVNEHVRNARFFFQLTSTWAPLLFASPSQKLYGNLNKRCLRSVRHPLICFTFNLPPTGSTIDGLPRCLLVNVKI
jgi:hypothetical protein